MRHRNETKLWDYKQELPLQEKADVAEFARDVLAFHNTEGGAIVAGVSNYYRITGIPTALALDTKRLRDKLRPYAGDDVELFQDSVDLKDNTCVWIIFVPKNPGAPRVILQDAPIGKGGKRSFVKGDIFFRDPDETRKCVSENDYQRLFSGFSSQHLVAYNYEIDEPYFRLLNANCEQFIGRKEQLHEVRDALNSRHPIVALDGLGGVGKTAGSSAVSRTKMLFYFLNFSKERDMARSVDAYAPGIFGSPWVLERVRGSMSTHRVQRRHPDT